MPTLTLAIALALNALPIDVAVATWWSGSPTRRRVIVPVATYAIVMKPRWRWIPWPTHATMSAFLALVAVTAWRPGGLSIGVRITGS